MSEEAFEAPPGFFARISSELTRRFSGRGLPSKNPGTDQFVAPRWQACCNKVRFRQLQLLDGSSSNVLCCVAGPADQCGMACSLSAGHNMLH